MQHVLNLYCSGSQPFPTRGPLDKFCLGSWTTQNFYILSGKFLNFWRPFLSFFLNFVSVRGPQKEFRQFSPFPCIFQGQVQKKHFNFHLHIFVVYGYTCKFAIGLSSLSIYIKSRKVRSVPSLSHQRFSDDRGGELYFSTAHKHYFCLSVCLFIILKTAVLTFLIVISHVIYTAPSKDSF